ncbi:hypothetical protein niasHT_020153 [Heterodera trifolii]|uniref:Protein kinase domain-containing protein n=1 Tax=Heterodera trifolii TaxID=157864 RepID=A0ABD2KIB8_9BILA
MKTLKYTSAKPGQQNKPVEIKYSASNLNEKEIYIGFTGENENLPKNKCAVIKIYNKGGENSVKIQNKLKEIDPKNGHFVNLIDHGTIDKQNQIKKGYEYLTLLELGERDLNEEFERIHGKFSTSMKSKVMSIMKTLVKMHEVGVHLDFKPTNVVVIERKLHPSKYKLIDFDGSVLYSGGEKKGKIRRSDFNGYTEDFTAPELLQNLSKFEEDDVEVNPKMDIWSAGITIFQILLIPKRKWRRLDSIFDKVTMVGQLFRCVKLNSVSENEMKELLAKIGKPMDKQNANANANANQQSSAESSSETSSEQENDVGPAERVLLDLRLPVECVHPGEKDWWKKYWEVIADILSIWTEVPEIAFLSVNMLNIDAEKRMTAKGALEYLSGKCKPREYEKNHREIALFGDVSAEKLQKFMKMEGFNSTKMEENLSNAEKSLQLFLKELEKRKEFCDQ